MESKNKKIGIIFMILQAVATVWLLLSVYRLGMLPGNYFLALSVVLALVFLLCLFVELKGKRKKIIVKIISGILTIAMVAASFFVNEAATAMERIADVSEEMIQIDTVVVAVLAKDSAETLEDAAHYKFGVQYSLKGEEIKETVAAIKEELEKSIDTKEYVNIQEQLSGIFSGEVQAVIFNEAYMGILEEEFPEIETAIKIIYTKNIEKKVEIAQKQEEVQVEEETFIVYISGIDVYGSIKKTSRSDVNILAVVNPNTRQILLITTPRDYYVEFPGVTGGQRDKLTHAGIYGVDVSMATLGQLYGIEPDFYARVNFTSLVEMVDALGGVDVYSEYAFRRSEVSVSEGMNHFNGKEALAFSRERYQLPGGDFQRGKNQQAVITAMIQKATSPAILKGATGILESISGSVDTNMSIDQIQELVKEQLANPVSWDITSIAAEGKGDSQRCYSMPGRSLYVAWPVEESVNNIKLAIGMVKEGRSLKDVVGAE